MKYGEDTGHLVEVVFSFTKTLLSLNAEQNNRDLCPLGVPVRAVNLPMAETTGWHFLYYDRIQTQDS
jgi:hypothetical protein